MSALEGQDLPHEQDGTGGRSAAKQDRIVPAGDANRDDGMALEV